MTEATEEWRPVVGWEPFYEVSNLGNVRSRDRATTDVIGRTRRFRGQALSPVVNPQTGRREVKLKGGGRRVTRTVYPMVLEAFVGPRPVGLHACHDDGDQQNDRLSNLRWDSRSGNMLDVVRHGRHHNANKERCNVGHLLVEPNLRLAKDGRGCRACHRARSAATHERRMGRPEPDHKSLADWQYERIMRAG